MRVIIRDEMNKNPKETLAQVASYGYKFIEGYEGDQGLFWGMTNLEFKDYLDSLGLKMIASHCGNTNDLPSFKIKCAQASEIGVEYLICPWAEGERSIKGFEAIAETFNKCGQIAKDISAYDGQTVRVGIHCVSNDSYLLQMDSFVVEGTLGLNDVESLEMNVYPNPVSGEFVTIESI